MTFDPPGAAAAACLSSLLMSFQPGVVVTCMLHISSSWLLPDLGTSISSQVLVLGWIRACCGSSTTTLFIIDNYYDLFFTSQKGEHVFYQQPALTCLLLCAGVSEPNPTELQQPDRQVPNCSHCTFYSKFKESNSFFVKF